MIKTPDGAAPGRRGPGRRGTGTPDGAEPEPPDGAAPEPRTARNRNPGPGGATPPRVRVGIDKDVLT